MKTNKRMLADASLLLVAVVWGSAFVAQRTAAGHVGPFAFNAARFALGGLILLPLAVRRGELGRAWRGGLALGVLLFGAAALQQIGMRDTTAGKAGFITGLYIVIVPLMLAVIWRDRARRAHWLGAIVAAAGLFLLSVQGEFRLAPGDGWVLLSALLWSLHVIAIGRIAPGREATALAVTQYAVCAALSGLMAVAAERDLIANTFSAWPEIAYTGVLSIGLGYTLQVAAQRHTPPTHAAILLSLEAVFAALFGWQWLGEALSARQIAGCGLMLLGMGLAQANVIKTRNNEEAARRTASSP